MLFFLNHTLLSMKSVIRSACMGLERQMWYRILMAASECSDMLLLNIRYLDSTQPTYTCQVYEYLTVKSCYFVGTEFHGLTTMDMFVDT